MTIVLECNLQDSKLPYLTSGAAFENSVKVSISNYIVFLIPMINKHKRKPCIPQKPISNRVHCEELYECESKIVMSQKIINNISFPDEDHISTPF